MIVVIVVKKNRTHFNHNKIHTTVTAKKPAGKKGEEEKNPNHSNAEHMREFNTLLLCVIELNLHGMAWHRITFECHTSFELRHRL